MVFSSPIFIFLFLPIVFLAHLVAPAKLKNMCLLMASLLFYGWGEPVFVLLMILLAIVNYGLARGLESSRLKKQAKRQRFLLFAAVSINLGSLALFKYLDFFIRSLNRILSLNLSETGLPLPIGISFFIFQALSYVIDVYRQETPVQKRLDHLMLYISFFPQLIAGPIIKYHDIADQITHRRVSLEKTAVGLRRFILGLAKKLLIANQIGLIADQVYQLSPADLTMAVSWLGAFSYLIQIYFDFSGYSDMAIGLGKMFGFSFKENFNYPYIATSLQDFWRRWHISLSTWFKEYLYIPLGGNRRGLLRTGLNRVLVFLLTGLWHGASWNFVIWGLLHGLFFLLETYGLIQTKKLWRPLRHVYTLFVVLMTFVIFRAETFAQSLGFFQAMLLRPFHQTPAAAALWMRHATAETAFLFIFAILCSLPWALWLRSIDTGKMRLAPVWVAGSYVLTLLLFFICILAVASQSYNPFIYFRF